MNAAENLTFLDDPSRFAGTNFAERTATWPVDACYAEDLDRRPGGEPGLLRRDPQSPAFGGRANGARLIRPFALPVAVNADGRQIPNPFETLCMNSDGVAERSERRIAFFARSGGNQEVRRLAHQRRVGRPENRFDT